MNKNKMAVMFLVASTFSSLATAASPTSGTASCARTSSSNPTSIAAARQQKVIYGPYTVTCASGLHSFQVRGAPNQPRVSIQKLTPGGWSSVTPMTNNPSAQLGAGTYRLVLSNTHYNNIQSYAVSYSVPR